MGANNDGLLNCFNIFQERSTSEGGDNVPTLDNILKTGGGLFIDSDHEAIRFPWYSSTRRWWVNVLDWNGGLEGHR